MLKIVAIMFGGMAVGFLLRRRRMSWIMAVITILIWLLLFFLGVDVGENEKIIYGLKDLGLEALFLAFAGIAGSVLLAWGLWVMAQKKGGDR